MDIFEKLTVASVSIEKLNDFLNKNENSLELSDFFISQSYVELQKHKDKIVNYILLCFNVYERIDFSLPNQISFVSYLLEYSERFGLFTEFEGLYNLHLKKKLSISSRLEAASKYLIGIRNINDYADRISEVLNLLEKAYLEEEDNSKFVVATIVNYYAQVVYNFASQNKKGVERFRKKLNDLVVAKYSFLQTEIYETALSLRLTDNVEVYQKIQGILDKYLLRTIKYQSFNRHTSLLEDGTRYAYLIKGITADFRSLRILCSKLYQRNADKSIFYSLQRGVAVLTEEKQMWAYMHSYGNMHYAKMFSAIDESNMLADVCEDNIEVYDWGCGQGLASFIFQEMHHINNSKVVLIEPSEICLKRAALHVRKINPKTEVITINKDLDSLAVNDFNSQMKAMKIHLFSNILDVQSFAMEKLLDLINESFYGSNIFVCVSPFINETRANRLNNFMNTFRNCQNFKTYLNIDNKKGNWERNWSRSIRVFRAIIHVKS